LLNTLHEDGVLISLICHAPVAMVSAKYRVAGDGQISTTSDHHFKGARLTAVPRPSTTRPPSSGNSSTAQPSAAGLPQPERRPDADAGQGGREATMSKIVLITGASSGIGRATALELLGAGYTVCGGARRVESLDAVTASGVREFSGHGPYHDLAEGLATSTEALYRGHGKALESTRPKPRYPVGYMARPLLALNRFLPARLFDRVASSQIA
jgi:putative intracellular protease/amidase